MKQRTRLATRLVLALLMLPLLVVAVTESRARHYTGVTVPSYQEMLDIIYKPLTITKLTGVWKYKSPSIETSEQVCVVGGNYQTSLQSFNNMTPTTFTVRTQGWHAYSPTTTGDFSGFSHTFNLDPSEIKGDGTSCSKKFLDYPTVKSGDPKPVKYGTFKAKIKNGRMSFVYSIPKANEGGLLVATDMYWYVRNNRTQEWFREYSHEKETGGGYVWFRAGAENAYGEVACNVKVGVNASKAKLQKKKK